MAWQKSETIYKYNDLELLVTYDYSLGSLGKYSTNSDIHGEAPEPNEIELTGIYVESIDIYEVLDSKIIEGIKEFINEKIND